MKNRSLRNKYRNSTRFLKLAETLIPLGSQTFSKSRTQFPVGVSPLFAKSARGCEVIDLDNNKYLDMISSLASVTLGYDNKQFISTLKKEMIHGITPSLATEIEFEVASKINKFMPSLEKIRFGKTGSDANAAAIRLARAYTGKKIVLSGGYHGWHDWYIGSTSMNLGVPPEVRALTHKFTVNNFDEIQNLVLNKFKNKVACVILEPISYEIASKEFLVNLRKICTKEKIILVFDEIVTGFRINSGGAQKYFDVYPDLTTLGKSLGNGLPISAVGGHTKIMKLLERVFFSGTHGGERLSLAAAKVVLNFSENNFLANKLELTGRIFSDQVENLIKEFNFDGLSLSGHPSWKFLKWEASKFKDINKTQTLFLQEMYKNGVLIIGSHNINLAHSKKNLPKLLNAYKNAIQIVLEAENRGNYKKYLECDVITPLFQTRGMRN